jgi:hypothetical protein
MVMAKFSTTQELNTVGDIHAIREQILKEMPENVLFAKSKEAFCFYVLNEFDFPAQTIKLSDITSIEYGCKTIMALMGIDDDFEKNLRIGSETKFDNQLDRFLHYFFDFADLPGVFKEQLEWRVKNDLDTINKYISEYEKIDFIKKGETPRNHNQRTQSDFYERCKEEKIKIENHLATGLNERAISKAGRDSLWGLAGMMMEEFRDRPYKLPMPKAKEYFDLESIDKVSHRLGEIQIKRGRELKELYKTDKGKFYSELETLIPDAKVLGSMQQQLKFLPYISEERKLIFDELLELYNTKKLFGFYALALTQIEGLFTEMCRMCMPGYHNPYAALPDKVNSVRPYHPYSENRFDYFQYHLPNLRNRFLHYGIDLNEKIEVLCKEILYDLEEVVSIFSALTIDANWLLMLIRKRDDTEFMRVATLSFYFKMIRSVKAKKQFNYFENEIKSLNETFIPDIVYNVVFDLDTRVAETLERIYESIKVQSAVNGFEVDLKTISLKEIASNKDKIKTALNELFTWQMNSEIEELLDTREFINSYKKYLDLNFISTEVRDGIEALNTKYNEAFKKIKLISLYTDFKAQD